MRKRIRGLEPLTFWLQTNGMLLLAVELYSLACMRLEAHDGRSVRRLRTSQLYERRPAIRLVSLRGDGFTDDRGSHRATACHLAS
jgi:hypothetical protein